MKSIYIIFSHSFKPHYSGQGQKTDQWESFENVEFVDRLKDRHYTDATAIVDYLRETIVKCRPEDTTYEDMINHANNKYPEQMAYLDQMILSLSENMIDADELQERAEKIKENQSEEKKEEEVTNEEE